MIQPLPGWYYRRDECAGCAGPHATREAALEAAGDDGLYDVIELLATDFVELGEFAQDSNSFWDWLVDEVQESAGYDMEGVEVSGTAFDALDTALRNAVNTWAARHLSGTHVLNFCEIEESRWERNPAPDLETGGE